MVEIMKCTSSCGRVATSAAATGATLQAVAVPNFALTDSFVPWIFVVLGLLVLVAAVSNRVAVRKDKEGYIKVDTTKPLGYDKVEVTVK